MLYIPTCTRIYPELKQINRKENSNPVENGQRRSISNIKEKYLSSDDPAQEEEKEEEEIFYIIGKNSYIYVRNRTVKRKRKPVIIKSKKYVNIKNDLKISISLFLNIYFRQGLDT